jgi:hypothetical protein
MAKEKSQNKKNVGGRPPLFTSAEELYEKGRKWLEELGSKNLPLTVTGLALALGFTSRQALLNYEGKPDFVDAIKRLKTAVEMGYEVRLHGHNPTGAIFALKNMNWHDEHMVVGNPAKPLTIITFNDKTQAGKS